MMLSMSVRRGIRSVRILSVCVPEACSLSAVIFWNSFIDDRSILCSMLPPRALPRPSAVVGRHESRGFVRKLSGEGLGPVR